MKDWNLVVTIVPGAGHLREVLRNLGHLGWFAPTPFKDVCTGKVEDVAPVLEGVLAARTACRALGRHGRSRDPR